MGGDLETRRGRNKRVTPTPLGHATALKKTELSTERTCVQFERKKGALEKASLLQVTFSRCRSNTQQRCVDTTCATTTAHQTARLTNSNK